ncbi:16S rRNA (adenine1518-N6/adenine1519-N6)-dimethyltransferase [Orenia metallireducens]|jgi:16S rRNA (adenine1518-N6/adenine1519-N6)-dimethyltransferase|uniref:Ribosomal RNA small subunit methyltransferase A n=1 Tax=Orenia metallireducens TaxID=1413210 RepID=A0A285GZ55_9FIRM|nr:16S rRNA (adenine(1518)-N(6)/adenine(1519)-N(6))-dimethyltransferase RsmA [Orenia metallireducens]PRX26460.1 16S rRNA (adenine1518-N6/adenine1519-N6)-dimethyltransferase [Orenia metallireducens]SNY28777.1 16S rRNA (adenine1518-N6/adenine1519-N6)-dimethyltransferase [Orenia metallireducens]
MEIANPSNTKDILRKHNLQLKKSLGQNFLIDNNILNKIVETADLTEEDTVIEIGPGIGSLTQKMAETGARVIAVELDDRLIPVLKESLNVYNNIEIVHGDALEVDFSELVDGSFKLVANLPYYITTPIIMRLLEEGFDVEKIVVMIQKEVGERMVASPGGKDYGILSIGVQYHSNPEIAFVVPPTVFIPQPKVESVVIDLKVKEEQNLEVVDEEFFFKVVKSAFHQRRKTIRNSLSKAPYMNLNRDLIDQALEEVGIDPRRRAEKLSIETFAQLSNALFNLTGGE